MGVVYHATAPLPGPELQHVVVKFIHPQFLCDHKIDAVKLFEREIVTLSTVRHPHIVSFITWDIHPDPAGPLPYMVMPFIDGCPLTDYATQHRCTVTERIALLLPVCEGVQAMHALSPAIYHHDLKPANILVARGGNPYILDFGLAHAHDTTRQQDGPRGGTPAYMSPEQAGGQARCDQRSDIYTLGVILYELLAGRRPYPVPDRTSWETLYETIMHAPVTPLSQCNPACPEDLDRIVLKALAKKPEDRYFAVELLQQELKSYCMAREERVRRYRQDEADGSLRRERPGHVPSPSSGASADGLAHPPGPRLWVTIRRLSSRVPQDSYMAALASLSPLKPQVRYAANPGDLAQISHLEAVEYGADSIDQEGLVRWWRRYPKGVHLVQVGAEIVGAIGLWPIGNRVFDKMVCGEMEETELQREGHPDDIAAAQGPYSCWYVGDIIVSPRYRQQGFLPRRRHPSRPAGSQVVRTLLDTAVTRWLQSDDLAPMVDLCAFGFTEHGRQFLAHFGFRRDAATTSPLGYPIYQLTSTREELHAACASILPQRHATPWQAFFAHFGVRREGRLPHSHEENM